jgi:D-alanyl-D-alanine dipeptidase
MNANNYTLPETPPELGITFTEPTKAETEQFENELAIIADNLGVSAPTLALPERGFIGRRLTSEQHAFLTNLLDPIYSRIFTDMQDKVRYLPIHESGERMIALKKVFDGGGVPASFSERPITPYGGIMSGKPRIYFTRETAATTQLRAAEALGKIGVRLHFEDAFRPLGVQEGLFQHGIELAQAAHPNYDIDAIIAKARSKVAVTPHFAGHKGGAATDLSLINQETGTRLDTGHEYLDHGACVILDFPYLTFPQFRARQLFAQSMKMAGMDIYPGEDWHASLGDVGAAMASGTPSEYPVKYGPIKGFDPVTGDIDPYDPSEYYERFNFIV